jgi:hypothetical protein
LDNGIFVVFLKITTVYDSPISFFCKRENVIKYLGDRNNAFARELFQTIEDIGMLDNIVIDSSWGYSGTDDSSESSSISIVSECCFFSFLEFFHFSMIGNDDEDTVFEESGFFELEIKIE